MTTASNTWYEKRYNEIALHWLAGTEPDATTTNDLRTIAQACLPDGGRAVLDARGLCAVWLKEYYDEGNCSSLQQRSVEGETPSVAEESPILRILPNPAHDVVNVSLNLSMDDGEQIKVQVFNLNGQNIHEAVLPSANTTLSISVQGWPEGVYVAKLIANNKIISKTFVVQHR
ncbi:MAG: T9SS type A sorting domain-containing protein [Saprospiraceae bacterium]|nr:T9SS type A sorting domain-containing protein [Saprospiraceae bacterium]MCF8250889.1 T9SS type A sorting domain-containing protein [Saprospiraceae bacterium]MCF8281145.1 T9SS type A sorting domain-containing protein [Bacteroidales bacterium]MCF8312710.1 T9SS type A sorting domain-containing protein [Saprospiraceae bacterium]MCF8441157.1 T9SS type A sorting domain-containing protein [Saprospiraceae bacterium]